MQIRCNFCHKPFAIGKEEVRSALDEITEQKMHHYNVYCPHCRKANRVSPDELHRAAPDWGQEPEKGS